MEENETKIMCSDSDYEMIIKIILSLSRDINTTNINIIGVHENINGQDNSFVIKSFLLILLFLKTKNMKRIRARRIL